MLKSILRNIRDIRIITVQAIKSWIIFCTFLVVYKNWQMYTQLTLRDPHGLTVWDIGLTFSKFMNYISGSMVKWLIFFSDKYGKNYGSL